MIFVTGSGGYIGSALCGRLVVEGLNFRKIDTKLLLDPNQNKLGDFFCNEKSGEGSIIIHAAGSGVYTKNSFDQDVKSNVLVTDNLISAAYKYGVRKFIILGSCFEYGLTGNSADKLKITDELLPIGSYALSKVFQYQVCLSRAHELNLDLTYLRLFQVYGGNEKPSRLFPSMMRSIKAGEDFQMSEGTQVRDFIHINIVSDYIVNEIRLLDGFQCVNVSSGVGTSVRDFVNHFWTRLNANANLLLKAVEKKDLHLNRLVGEPSHKKNRLRIDSFDLYPNL